MFGGALASFIGIGAGSVYIPALVIFYGYSQLAAQAVSLLIISPTSALGAWHYYRKKQINLSLALSILPYAVIGVILGSLLSGVLPVSWLRKAFSVLLVYVAWINWRS